LLTGWQKTRFFVRVDGDSVLKTSELLTGWRSGLYYGTNPIVTNFERHIVPPDLTWMISVSGKIVHKSRIRNKRNNYVKRNERK